MPNRLADSSSPYLRQHAGNPVDWHPWDEEALTLARESGRPILLSIGYAACHWCHVMAHESFEDEATAAIMNRRYVNVKVDREERPDLDKIYQTAQMLLTRRGGGWPLTMFLTPAERAPFFGGTYFPPEPRHGLPAFPDLLERLAEWYAGHAGELAEQNESVRRALQDLYAPPAAADWPADLEAGAVEALARQFDPRQGGFGDAPKFPRPTQLRWLLAQDDARARHMAAHTLERMAEGGLQDHAGGGFYRYSVDAQWMIPHFEKMLYDQALLLPLYAEAAAALEQPALGAAAAGIASFVTRELQDGSGGFYSSLDADSEGEEGRFYLWTPAEVEALLPAADYAAFAFRYGLDREANFEGRWHLHAFRSLDEAAARFGRPAEELRAAFDAALPKLLEARAARVRPGLDDKMLTAWNALMVSGLARAAELLGEPAWLEAAQAAFAHLRGRLWDGGRLHASCSRGRAALAGYLDDYAFALEAVLLLLEARWDAADLAFAEELAAAILAHFEDGEGGLYFTAHDHEELLARPRLLADDVTPAGAAVACECLARLGFLLGRGEWVAAAERILGAARGAAARAPVEHARFLQARRAVEEPAPHAVLRGAGEELARWRAEVRGRAPCFAAPADAAGLPEALAAKPAPESGAAAYVCTGTACAEPLRDFGAWRDWLERA